MKALDTLSPSKLHDAIHRNIGIITSSEQAHLGSARILVAGCGSVGGSIVEPLTRTGMNQFVLADPEDYDVTNLNRQVCLLQDVGRKKVDVVAERAKAINPSVETITFKDGLTEANIYDAFEGVNIVFDGIDAGASPWVKYLMHKIACERRIPVLSGFDFGGKAVIYVFDYRRYKAPFNGRSTEQAHKDGNLVSALKWLGYTQYPADFLPVIADRLVTKDPWPQVSYCVMAMGALGVRTVIDLLMARRVPHKVTFDVNMASRGLWSRVQEYISWPLNLLHTFRVSRNFSLVNAEPVSSSVSSPTLLYLGEHPTLALVLQVMTRSPSPHNCQPWRFRITGPNTIQLGWDQSLQLNYIDPDGYAIMYSLGCALEAASSIANIEFEPSEQSDFFATGYYVGTIHIKQIDSCSYARNRDLNLKRSTNRFSFLPIQLPDSLKESCCAAAYGTESDISFLEKAPTLLKQTANRESVRLFSEDGYFNELMDFMRLTQHEEKQKPTGFTKDSLAITRIEALFLSLLKKHRLLQWTAKRLGLRKIMAWSSTKALNDHGSYMLVSTRDWSDKGRFEVGRVIMRTWLTLTRADIACQPVDFPISSKEGRETIRSLFGIDDDVRPVLLMRLGRATRTHSTLSLRKPLAEFVELVITNSERKANS
ncbi:ThiF family adenylyltransferase [Idiomarina sp. Sol25]|uniref:ThiF family adenylyltransferase n=1 Tax=Idiomarina sp. Sol25 TaxID=3064000 RepID=UPI00294AF4D3|nr:ThiF family adenylyltransferase [Idiomarina sp. Sol25]MDV6328539.1 ThiF family adenylyltransferase [Idiomarina sp. Sol25]